MPNLSEAGKDELALALILWKDFKTAGKFDADVTLMTFRLAEHVGVKSNVEKMLSKVPPMKIEPRYPVGEKPCKGERSGDDR